MITGLEHIAIASLHPHQLAGWYLKTLNFSLILDTGTTIYLRAPNGAVLEFVSADTRPAAPLIRDAGLRHLALTVDDFEATSLELKSAGVVFAEPPVELPGLRLHFFQDPDGNFLHLVEREAPLI